jgi:hypothetical protein
MSLEVTNSLRSALGELYYKEGCDQKGWAYIPLDNIKFRDDSILPFKKGSHNINIKIMESIIPEIKEMCRPVGNSRENPGFVYDYLACKVGQRDRYDGAIVANPTALCWVKIKTGRSRFSRSQVDALEKIKLPLALFSINDVFASPRKIEVEWDIRSSEDWLNELDDLRDQTEYDDEYF